jgi:hypothetical protein
MILFLVERILRARPQTLNPADSSDCCATDSEPQILNWARCRCKWASVMLEPLVPMADVVTFARSRHAIAQISSGGPAATISAPTFSA